MAHFGIVDFREWLMSREAEPWFAVMKLPLELGIVFFSLLAGLYSKLLAQLEFQPGNVETLISLERWSASGLGFRFFVAASVSLLVLSYVKSRPGAVPIRLKRPGALLWEISRASVIVFLVLLQMDVLSSLDPSKGTPNWVPSIVGVGVYTTVQAIGLFFLWGARRLVWIERTGEVRQWPLEEVSKEEEAPSSDTYPWHRSFSTNCMGTIHIHSFMEMEFFQVEEKMVQLHKREGRAYGCDKSLQSLEGYFGDDVVLRIHKNTLVFIHQVKECRSREKKVVMRNGAELKIADHRLSHVRKTLEGQSL